MMAVAKAPMDNSMTMDYTNATDLTQNDDDQAQQELLQEAMGDNLEMMLAVIMKIREDKDYAKSIYADCPRLQHFLDLHPDLRPVFEDQKLVLINFEQVYRKAGGVLPEDKPNRIRNCIVCIVKHPLFKLLRFLLLIKKIYTCVTGTGVALLKQCICSCFAEKATQAAGENLANVDDGGVANAVGDPTNAANSEALNRAADYMSDPAVYDKMQGILVNNPDGLDQAIAQDPELSALRDANPLCAELMSDVETMKILVDPDNLRALADCPNLIALDFTNPSWSPQDIETGIFDDLANAGSSSNNNNASFSDSYNRGQQLTNSLSKSRGNEDGGSRLGLMVSSLSLGIADYIATQTIGSTVNDFVGGGNNFGAPAIVDGAIAAADTTEACMDNLESNIADEGGSKAKSVDRVKAANSNVPFGELGVADESGADNDETKKGSFRQVSRAAGGSLAALSAVAKEQVVFTLLGNDLGDVYLNKMERGNEDKEDGEQAEEGNDKSKPSLFRRKKPG